MTATQPRRIQDVVSSPNGRRRPGPPLDDGAPWEGSPGPVGTGSKAETPTLLPWGEGYVVEWLLSGMRCEVSRIYEDKAAFWCELTWYAREATGWEEIEGGGRTNLLVPANRAGAVKGMLALGLGGLDWTGMYEQLYRMVIRRHREGEPSVALWDVETSVSLRFLLKPFVAENETTILFGDSGVAKSMLALSMAVSLSTGVDWADSYPVAGGGPVLYLDWETSAQTHARRLQRLCQPLGIVNPRIRYRRMYGSLADQVGALKGEVDRYGIKVVVVDSLGWATADEPKEAAAAIRVMDATRRLGVTAICLGHVTKESRKGGNNRASVFGSAFFEAAARMTWEVKGKTDEQGNKALSMKNWKFNEGRLVREPIGIGVDYGGGFDTPIAITPLVISDASGTGTRASTSISDRITNHLKRAGRATYAELAAATGASEASVRLAVQRKPDDFRKRDMPDGKLAIELCAESIPGMEQMGDQVGLFSGTPAENQCSVCDQPLTRYDVRGSEVVPFCDLHAPPDPPEES